MQISTWWILVNQSLESQKEYTRLVEWHPISLWNCEVLVYEKNTIITRQWKDIGSKSELIACNKIQNPIIIQQSWIDWATNWYIEQNQESEQFEQFVFKFKKDLIEQYNQFFISKKIDLTLSWWRWTTIKNTILNLPITSWEIINLWEIISALRLLSLFYWKWTDPFTNCTINLPLNPYNFKKSDWLIWRINELVKEWLRVKIWKTDSNLIINISDYQILQLFTNRWHPDLDTINIINYNSHLSKLFNEWSNFNLDLADKTLKIVSTN